MEVNWTRLEESMELVDGHVPMSTQARNNLATKGYVLNNDMSVNESRQSHDPSIIGARMLNKFYSDLGLDSSDDESDVQSNSYLKKLGLVRDKPKVKLPPILDAIESISS